ncbi:Multisite-specific tRNA:(cytosine-C(5))-methyltransferase trm4b [Dictyocoela muelleri]|nr:Multisite-specific tRNA:(cytosine-C(5))-methyltransferase trm4b [Dictyocoela muelleri]
MNTDFINYYKKKLLLADHDFEELINFFKRPLPITFRFTNHPLSQRFFNKYQEYFEKVLFFEKTYTIKVMNYINLKQEQKDKEIKDKKDDYNKNPLDEIKMTSQTFPMKLNWFNNAGIIIRQELVSMVPVTLMDISKSDIILDMCASPGSKTTQILELTDSLVIANDNNLSRINILRSQTNKIPSPGLVITRYDARYFPDIHLDCRKVKELNINTTDFHIDNNKSIEQNNNDQKSNDQNFNDQNINDQNIDDQKNINRNINKEQISFLLNLDRKILKFDKILCDVPCSGDATYRKNKGNWKQQSFFKLQSGILKRASELVKENGLIVYSTCSLNPKENEDVVRCLINGTLFENDQNYISKNDEYIFSLVEKKIETNNEFYLPNGMKVREGIGEDMKKCIRIYPHDNDTGGFFIAVIKKTKRINKDSSKVYKEKVYKDKVDKDKVYKDKINNDEVYNKKSDYYNEFNLKQEIINNKNFIMDLKIQSSTYFLITESFRSILSSSFNSEYDLETDSLLITTKNFKIISRVNIFSYFILLTNLKVEAIGCKVYKRNFNGETYRSDLIIKKESENILNKSFKTNRLPLSDNQFKELLENGFFYHKSDFLENIVFLEYKEFLINGFSNGEKIFIFIGNEYKKLLKDLFFGD